MTNTELIRQEIERRMSYWWEKLPDADKDTAIWTQDEAKALGEYMAYESLLDFIDSLQQEQPEVDLENYIFNKLRELDADFNSKLFAYTRGLNVGRTNAYRDILNRLNARKEK